MATAGVPAPSAPRLGSSRSENQRYAYRRFGNSRGLPCSALQHFTGTLDNWDPGVRTPSRWGARVILFDNAGVGRSTGEVPNTVAGMAQHAMAFLDGLGLTTCDVLGFSLGGMIAQQIGAGAFVSISQDDPGGHRSTRRPGHHAPGNPVSPGTSGSGAQRVRRPGQDLLCSNSIEPGGGEQFVERLSQRKTDREPASGPAVAQAQIAAFREWEQFSGDRLSSLRSIRQPTLVVNGIHDQMIPVANSYFAW